MVTVLIRVVYDGLQHMEEVAEGPDLVVGAIDGYEYVGEHGGSGSDVGEQLEEHDHMLLRAQRALRYHRRNVVEHKTERMA